MLSVMQRAELLHFFTHVLDRFDSRWVKVGMQRHHRHAKPTRKSPSAHALRAMRMACTSSQACFQKKLQFKK
jgi:hypothetical protein